MNEQDNTQRTVLPMPDQPRKGLVTYDAKDPETRFPPIRQLRPPKGAPNVLIVLIDDAGFGSYFYAESSSALPQGDHQVRMEFAYAGGGLGKGGTASLYVDGKKVGEGKIGATEAIIFSGDDGCDVGVDTGAPVSPDYGSRGNEFSGRVKGVQLAIAEDAESVDHLVSPEEAIRIAMARQ